MMFLCLVWRSFRSAELLHWKRFHWNQNLRLGWWPAILEPPACSQTLAQPLTTMRKFQAPGLSSLPQPSARCSLEPEHSEPPHLCSPLVQWSNLIRVSTLWPAARPSLKAQPPHEPLACSGSTRLVPAARSRPISPHPTPALPRLALPSALQDLLVPLHSLQQAPRGPSRLTRPEVWWAPRSWCSWSWS